MKLVLTGGHLTPAEAILERLETDTKVLFFGRLIASVTDKIPSQEKRVVSYYSNVKFIPLSVVQTSFLSFFTYLPAFIKALLHLNRFAADAVLSFGGYLSLPVCLAACFLRIPVFIHEQTCSFGLANSLVAIWAKKIFLAHRLELHQQIIKKTVVVGNPLRKEVFSSKPSKTIMQLVRRIKKKKSRKIILVSGGNQGAQQINRLIHQLLPQLLGQYLIIHQTGMSEVTNDYAFSLRLKAKLKPELSQYYFPFDYLRATDMGFCLREADLVISRSGANTVWELAALNKRALLLPLLTGPSDEQLLNAQWLQQIGRALVIKDREIAASDLFKMIKILDHKRVKKGTVRVERNVADKIIDIIKTEI